MLTYLNFLKTSAALERNVQKVVADLLTVEDRCTPKDSSASFRRSY